MLASGERSPSHIAESPALTWTTDTTLAVLSVSGVAAEDFEPLTGTCEAAHWRALAGECVAYDALLGGRPYRAFLRPLRGSDGEIAGVAGSAFDDTARDFELRTLRRERETLGLAQAAAHLAHWVRDAVTDETTWSDELYVLCGLAPGCVAPSWELFASYVHPDDTLALEAAIDVARDARRPFLVDTRIVGEDGVMRWVQHRGTHVYDGDQTVRTIGTLLDITVRKRAEDELADLAYFDQLTGLPNRKRLADRLRLELVQSQNSGERLAVLSLDLDRFKTINGTLGHETGDRFLRAVAARLKEAVRDTDIVARVGGDAFVLVLLEIPSLEEPARVAERIVATFAKPVALDERELYSSASVGIGIFPDDAATALDLIQAADTALARSKAAGPGTFTFYERVMHQRAVDRLELEHDLHRAYERSEFVLHYQAIVDRAQRPVAVETLLRWEHPVHGTIGPERFIPLCEETGLIVPLGRWVIRNAVAQLARWDESGLAPLRLALNISSRQIVDPDLPKILAAAVEEAGCRPNRLELEITESAAMADVPSARRLIRDLKALGMRIALDDFGTGYSSLSHLKHFDVDGLKIDQTFVRDFLRDRGDAAIVSAVVALGRALDLKIVAEGIETAEQAAFAWQLGCEELQGYYFARPLGAEEFESSLRAWSSATTR